LRPKVELGRLGDGDLVFELFDAQFGKVDLVLELGAH
jgi:hypothetical protein